MVRGSSGSVPVGLNRKPLDGASSLQLIPWLNGQLEVQFIPARLPTQGNPGQTRANQGKPDLKATPLPRMSFEPPNRQEASPPAPACWIKRK